MVSQNWLDSPVLTKRQRGALFSMFKTGGKGYCIKAEVLLKKLRSKPKLLHKMNTWASGGDGTAAFNAQVEAEIIRSDPREVHYIDRNLEKELIAKIANYATEAVADNELKISVNDFVDWLEPKRGSSKGKKKKRLTTVDLNITENNVHDFDSRSLECSIKSVVDKHLTGKDKVPDFDSSSLEGTTDASTGGTEGEVSLLSVVSNSNSIENNCSIQNMELSRRKRIDSITTDLSIAWSAPIRLPSESIWNGIQPRPRTCAKGSKQQNQQNQQKSKICTFSRGPPTDGSIGFTNQSRSIHLNHQKSRVSGDVSFDITENSKIRENETVENTKVLHKPKARFTCRKCRFLLFTQDDLETHQIGVHGFGWQQKRGKSCQSLFVSERLPWMTDCTYGIENKTICPKCRTKLGSIKWCGAQCSCGTWITPALQFPLSKIDVKFL